jgi:methylmalonyl-CoA mutase N-terminal domain/subunit
VAEIIGVAGLLVSILGFTLAIMQLRKVKNAAMAAKESSDATSLALQQNSILVDVTTCINMIDHTKTLIQGDEYKIALIRVSDLAAHLSRVRNLEQLKAREDKSRFGEMLAQLRILRDSLQGKVNTIEYRFSKRQAVRKLGDISDALNDLLGDIRFKITSGGSHDS